MPIKPSGDKLCLVCANGANLPRDIRNFWQWNVNHFTCVVNGAGLIVPEFDFWYSHHADALREWARPLKGRNITLVSGKLHHFVDKIKYVELPFGDGGSTMGAIGAMLNHFGAGRVVVAGLELPDPIYTPYREAFYIHAPDLRPYVRLMGGPLVGTYELATKEWCDGISNTTEGTI